MVARAASGTRPRADQPSTASAPRIVASPQTTETNRKRLLIAALVLLALAAIAWYVVRLRAAGPVSYRFAAVEQGDIQQTVSSTGALSAVKTVQVGTQVSGKVVAIFADFNDRVTQGQLVARIDPTLQEQAVRDAQAQLGKAQAQLAQAKAEYDRNVPLANQKFISASEFGTVQVNLSVAQAGVKSAQVTLERARQNLSYTNIYAPISGVVVERNVDAGQTVAASLSAPQLFLIAQDLSQMQILAKVDESDISSIKQGQEVQFTVQPYAGQTFHGSVQQVRLQSVTTDNVVSYTAVVSVANLDGKLLPGMTATVEFVTGSAKNALTVPNGALRYHPSPEELAASGLPATAGQRDTARRRAGGGSTSTGGAAGAGGAARGAGGGGGGGGGGGFGQFGQGGGTRAPRVASAGGGPGTLWTLDANKKLKPIRVRVGLTDNQRTQVTGKDLTNGMQVIVGSMEGVAEASAAPATTNPLAPQRGGGRRF